MKVYFINPPFKSEYGRFSRENRSPAITRSGNLYYPLWLIYAAAVCEQDGFEVEFLDAPATPLNETQSLEKIKANGGFETKLFVIETSTPSIYSDVAFGAKLKELYPKSKIMLVGTHPSALPDETLNIDINIDAVARHEFDFIVRDYARAIRNQILRGMAIEEVDVSDVRGITYRHDTQIISNPDMPPITGEDLDGIPFASKFIKEHLNYKDYFFTASAYPEIQMFTGRGCMAHCFFCVYPQTMHGHGYRMRSVENVIEEIKYIEKNFPDLKEIVFEDDTFTMLKDRVVEICDSMIESGLNKKLRWLCNARVNLDFDTMKKMKSAGCRLIIPGIESGNQQILNNIKKGTTIEMIHKYVNNAKKAGLLIHACYMVGNKGETKETMDETFRLALELDTDTAQFYPLLPFPGTEAYFWARENNYLHGGYEDYVKEDGTINSLLELPGISSEYMVEFCDECRKKYYLRPKYIAHRIVMGLKDPDDLKRAFRGFKSIKKFLLKKN